MPVPSQDQRAAAPLAELTTLGLGGPPRRLVEAASEQELIAAVRELDAAGEPLLVLAGGSNVVIADDGFDGTVVLVRTRGIERDGDSLLVQAGERWDDVVAEAGAQALAGIEALSGIPGSTGATPIQNVGAYGQDVSQTVASVRVLDRRSGAVEELDAAACAFTYRHSAFKGSDERIVLSVRFDLDAAPDGLGRPVAYAELARTLGVEVGERAPLREVREAVLRLRRGKGMVVDPSDPDSVSAGSFFTNPILDAPAFAALRARAAADGAGDPPAFPEPDGRVKTSAAWLIQRAGFERGHGDGRIGISAKHTLALVNRGGGTTAELVALAREIAAGVQAAFGVALVPEPVFIGHRW
ncbi:UDP-N-acetylmuramate dehydrogenase [Conexibacter arvalis]|uniref:UDP-N-acetylenolpyruvoylglucosamine reductase n=1 Tax=Conexibacter arvalis TaxID=912552 RepID=A0A840IH20_9ACTN|nr:UDP-N-acetylmuramate dehydrogenase [Conexibacter arvalis]MBB4663483.1 UDP-N-acetylmuramate dehydrogenase [Conexibacter arvalis]